MSDEEYLARALRLAERGLYTTHPNPRVGCLLVRAGRVVGEGYHLRAGEGHAEARALADAGDEARGATAYVTLEPCSFHGRTPSCAHALVEAGIARVVAAMTDPDPRNAGAGFRILRDAGVEVVTPLMLASARQLNPGHVMRHETGRPFVRLKLAMSLDGRTALASGESRWITGVDARRDVQRYRARSSAIVTGVQTIIDDDPLMTVRGADLQHESGDLASAVPRTLYVLDSQCRIPAGARVLSNANTVVVCTEPVSGALPHIVVGKDPEGRVCLQQLLRTLAERDCAEVLFECGATLAGALVREQLFDELIIYTAPTLMGDGARSLLNVPEIVKMTDLPRLNIADVRMVGRDIRVIATPESV